MLSQKRTKFHYDCRAVSLPLHIENLLHFGPCNLWDVLKIATSSSYYGSYMPLFSDDIFTVLPEKPNKHFPLQFCHSIALHPVVNFWKLTFGPIYFDLLAKLCKDGVACVVAFSSPTP